MSETAISLVSNNVPAHVKEASGLGNENVTAEHLQTPGKVTPTNEQRSGS